MGGKAKTPKAPDYAAAATAQGVANKETAIYNNAINRVDQVTPQGTETWTMKPGTDPLNPKVGDYIQTVKYSPTEQALYDSNNNISQQLLTIGQNQLGKVGQGFEGGIDTSGLTPTRNSGGTSTDYRIPTPRSPQQPQGGGAVGTVAAAMSGGGGGAQPAYDSTYHPPGSPITLAQASPGGLAAGTNRQGTNNTPVVNGKVFIGTGNMPGQGYYVDVNSPEAQAYQARFGNSGSGGQGNAASGEFNQGDQTYTSGGNTYAAGGGSIGNPAGVGRPAGGGSGANFGAGAVPGVVNDASRSRVEQALLSRIEPQYQQDESRLRTQLLNSGLEVGTAAYNSELDRLSRQVNDSRMGAVLAGGQEESRQTGLNAQLQQQSFNQGLAGAGFDNQTRQQQLQEQAYLRSLPLNELNALRTGNQVTTPQFGSYYTNNAQAAPIFDAANAKGNYNLQAAQIAGAGDSALFGGLATLGSAAIMASDIRLKTNIERTGTHPLGFGLFKWRWKDTGLPDSGVIAQDVRRFVPRAVLEFTDGFLRVNYTMIGVR